MLALFLVFFFCFVFLLCFVYVFFLVLLSVYEKDKLFSLQFWCFFWVMLVKRVVWFYVLCFCSCLFFLCCFFPFQRIHFYYFASVLLFFCHKTKWSSCLHLVVLLPFLFFLLFCFELCLFFIPLKKKDPPKKPDTAKTKKKKNAEKPDKKKVSAVVFTNSVLQFFGVGFKFWLFGWKHFKNSGFGIFSNR